MILLHICFLSLRFLIPESWLVEVNFHIFGHCSNGDWFALPKALCDIFLHHEYLMLSFRIIYLLLFFLVMLKSLSYSHLLRNRDSETLMLAAQERFQDSRECTAKYFIMISMWLALGLSQCSLPNCKVHVVLYHC